MSALPPAGCWALGTDGQALAEALVAQAQRAGLRTGWLAAEAGFLSNLNIHENLHLFLDWVSGDGDGFEARLAQAAMQLGIEAGDWLHARPAHLRAGQLLKARLLRLLLLRPDVVVLQPALLAQAGPALADPFIAALAGSRLLLLAEPTPEWPAWPPGTAPAGSAAATEAAVATPGAAAAAATGAAAPLVPDSPADAEDRTS